MNGELVDPYILHREQWIPRPPEEVFAFFANAGNLERLTPPWLNFQILTPPSARLEKGTRLEYRLRWRFLPIRWTTGIAAWQPPLEFEDVQLRGPYRLWRHTHRFLPHGGGTKMVDIVRYVLPAGPLGRWAHALKIRRDLEKIFDYRAARIREIFPAPGGIQHC